MIFYFEKNEFSKPIIAISIAVILVIGGITFYQYIARPEKQAKQILIDSVGEEYFNKYMKLWKVERNWDQSEDWFTIVGFYYFLEIGNYSNIEEITIFFDYKNQLIRDIGVPEKDNEMPFYITNKEAINLASSMISESYVEVDASIYYRSKTIDDVYVKKYVWYVVFYHTPREASSGYMTLVLVDLHSGFIFGVEESAWASTA